MYYLWDQLSWYFISVGLIISILQNTFYLITSFSNPGFPKASYEIEAYGTEERNFRQCKDCKIWINTEERTFHCYYCGICIEGI